MVELGVKPRTVWLQSSFSLYILIFLLLPPHSLPPPLCLPEISEVIDPHNSGVSRTRALSPARPPCSGPSRMLGASWELGAW